MRTVPEQIPLFAEPPPRVFVPIRPPVIHVLRPETQRIDWFRVITDVLRNGYSIQRAADEINVARTTLIGWRQGAEPRYSEGERLVLLWCKSTDSEREDLPMCSAAWDYHFRP